MKLGSSARVRYTLLKRRGALHTKRKARWRLIHGHPGPAGLAALPWSGWSGLPSRGLTANALRRSCRRKIVVLSDRPPPLMQEATRDKQPGSEQTIRCTPPRPRKGAATRRLDPRQGSEGQIKSHLCQGRLGGAARKDYTTQSQTDKR